MEWGINYWRGRSLIVVMRGLSWGFFFFLINHGGLISYEEGIVQSSKCEPKPVLTTSRFKNYVFNSTLCYAWGVPYSVLCSKIAWCSPPVLRGNLQLCVCFLITVS